MPDVIVLKDNGDGTYLGADTDGTIYDGEDRQVGFEDMTVTTTLTDDGFERYTTYGNLVYAKGSMNRAAFDKTRLRARRDLQEDHPEKDWPDLTQADLDAEWDAEVSIGAHDPAFNQDGTAKTVLITVWTAR